LRDSLVLLATAAYDLDVRAGAVGGTGPRREVDVEGALAAEQHSAISAFAVLAAVAALAEGCVQRADDLPVAPDVDREIGMRESVGQIAVDPHRQSAR